MKRTLLWFLAVLLLGGGIYLLFVLIPGGQSELARRGVKGYGQVSLKDSRPADNGQMVYFVTFIYQDEHKKNFRVTRRMYDVGKWNDLKAGQDIRVYYLPDNPEDASIEGAEGMAPPMTGTLRFLAWNMLIVALICGYLAYRMPKAPAPPKIIVTRR